MSYETEESSPQEMPQPSEEPMDVKPRARGRLWEWGILGLICLLCLGYWAFHYGQFYIPHADYPAFERLSQEIWSGQIPSEYKRMPMFPALMGGVARLIRHERPELHAALILSMVFSVGLLVMLYLFLRRMLGSVALVVVALMCVIELFHEMALLPLVEPLLGFMILLTLVLFQKRSRWQYVSAFFAALTRMEASALIFVLFLLNTFTLDWGFSFSWARARFAAICKLRWGKRLFVKNLIFAALASAGFIAWFVMARIFEPGDGFYSQLMGYTDPAFGFILRAMLEPFYGWLTNMSKSWPYMLGFFIVVGLPGICGLVISFRERMRGSFAALAFALIYTAGIIGVGMEHTRFVYPILWVPLMYVVMGWSWILPATMGWFARPDRGSKGKLVFAIIMCVITAAVAVYCLKSVYEAKGVAWQGVYPIYLGLLALVIGLYAWLALPDSRTAAISLGGILAIVILTMGDGGIGAHAGKSLSREYRNYAHHVSGMWLRDNLREGERAVLLRPDHATQLIDIPREQLIRFGHLKAQNMEELIPELEERNVTYVIYNYRNVPDEERSYGWLYYDEYRVDLAMLFEGVKDIPGFEHVATLELGDYLKYYDEPKPQVYRFVGLERQAENE